MVGLSAAWGRVRIRGLRLEGCHGVLDDEGRRPQPFVIDIDMDVDVRRAATEDDLRGTVDYAAVAAVVAEVVGGPRRRLIETLARDIAVALLARFPAARAGAVEVHKPKAPVGMPFDDVSVRYPFERKPGAPV